MDKTKFELPEITAEVYHGEPAKDRYYVKVTFVEYGMFINSFSVQPSKQTRGLWVSPPTHMQGGRYTTTVDFNKERALWKLVEKTVFEAVARYKDGNPTYPINLRKITF